MNVTLLAHGWRLGGKVIEALEYTERAKSSGKSVTGAALWRRRTQGWSLAPQYAISE